MPFGSVHRLTEEPELGQQGIRLGVSVGYKKAGGMEVYVLW